MIEETMESLEDTDELEEEAQAEVDKVLYELTAGKFNCRRDGNGMTTTCHTVIHTRTMSTQGVCAAYSNSYSYHVHPRCVCCIQSRILVPCPPKVCVLRGVVNVCHGLDKYSCHERPM